MNNFVITDIQIALTFHKLGLLKYFNEKELAFYITDICYENRRLPYNNDKFSVQQIIEIGLLKIMPLSEEQMSVVSSLYSKYKPKFIVNTITALVLAKQNGYKLLSHDSVLIETAKNDFQIKAINEKWFIELLVVEISTMGEKINVEKMIETK